MKKNCLLFIIIGFIIFISPVNAENKVDYTLTITDDYKFNEVIKYEISDYEHIVNGYNPFATIVEEDKIEVDILGKSTYKKTKTFKNGKYYVTLKHTYSEYSLSNSIFLNDCFENSKYEYDIDKYSFKGSGGFYCLNGDSLKITIITNKEVTDTNATRVGNTYIWVPTSDKFTMNMNITKDYKDTTNEESLDNVSEKKDPTITGDNSNIISDEENNQNTNTDEEQQTSPVTYITVGIIILTIAIIGLILFVILKNKKDNLNKI